jgi:hypothetical protein
MTVTTNYQYETRKEHPMEFSAVSVMRKLGLEPDPWQVEVLDSPHPRLLLNCCRQGGKSTTVALLALIKALVEPRTLVLLVSRSHRQSIELFRIVTDFLSRLRIKEIIRQNNEELLLGNRSRIVTLPCREETIRGYSNVNLLIIDEAARVPDDLYRAARPMLAVSQGRMICLSTPYGKRGFFWNAWARGGNDWKRVEVPAERIPRISAEFLEEERRALGMSWFRQEYGCSFEALEGLVYPDMAKCVVPILPSSLMAHTAPPPAPALSSFMWRLPLAEPVAPTLGQDDARPSPPPSPLGPNPSPLRRIGGMDFGFRNPFAAVWGVLDKDGVFWVTHEYYCREKALSFHMQHLPRDVMWYVDPSGAEERAQLIYAGFKVRKGRNDLRPGIAAVNARIQNGMLKIIDGACPNLLAEAGLYRYSSDPHERGCEIPLDEHNHGLAALRYPIASIDGRGFLRRMIDTILPPSGGPTSGPPQPPAPPKPKRDGWLRLDNEELWTRLWP